MGHYRKVIVLVALLVYYLAAQAVQALPIFESEPATVPGAPPNNCNDINECRTFWNIIWSCLATVFACTWIALHPNIPGPDDGWLRIALGKLGVMVLAVIAPEAVVMWAMRQWLVARRIAKEHERSMTHGFFALMGGFVRYEGGDGPYTLSPTDLRSHLRKDDITTKAIKDRSKGDVLSKGFAILQTGWFVLQCVARQYQHLPVTELEIITLAFAVLNFATYWLWWNKPLDVRDPFVVRDELGEKEDFKDIKKDKNASSKRIWKTIWNTIIHKVLRAIHSAINIVRKVPGAIVKAVWNAIGRSRHVEWSDAARVMDILSYPFLYPVYILGKMVAGDDDIEPRSKQVPTFYSGKLTE